MATIPTAEPLKVPPQDKTRSGKRRRPSGEAPPLPHQLQRSGKALIYQFAGVFIFLLVVAIFQTDAQIDQIESHIFSWVAAVRFPFGTSLAKFFNVTFGSVGTLQVLRWVTIVTLVVFKRFRHMFVYLLSLMIVGFLTTQISLLFVRARPVGVPILGSWAGSSLPSRPMAALAVSLLGMVYSLVPPGKPRTVAKYCAGAVMLILAVARIYLAVDHPLDILIGLVIGISVPVVAFRLLTPNDIFPVTYKRGRTAHLDVGGPRGQAIKLGLDDQLGLNIAEMKPFGLAGSGGSTPLRLTLVDGRRVFAKLYAKNHLRADRWYKLGRTLLYGRLEDEASFSTVRRLVQYEDYMLRVMSDAGLPTPQPYGIVEITPEREYLIVLEFFDGSSEILDVELNDELIDNALRLIRRLWDEGLAHRDVKPSNILAHGSDIHLIDVAFGQVRPSPWRQAVDLANMMILLGLKSDAETIYSAALRYFTPEEIAEAFAATHGVTIPSQSRGLLRKDKRQLVKRFRELAPPHEPIAIQRWSARRVGLTVSVLLGAWLVIQLAVANVVGAGLVAPTGGTQASYALILRTPACDRFDGEQMVLEAQAVPTATILPCVRGLPVGWNFHGAEIISGKSQLVFDSDRAGASALTVTLTETCDTSEATQVATSDEPGTQQFERIDSLGNHYRGERFYVFPGGCATYRFAFAGDAASGMAREVSLGIGFVSRDFVTSKFKELTGVDFE